MEAFAESIPFSWYLMDPGVDNEFAFEFEGTLDELLARIDQEEDKLIEMSDAEWAEVESVYNPKKGET